MPKPPRKRTRPTAGARPSSGRRPTNRTGTSRPTRPAAAGGPRPGLRRGLLVTLGLAILLLLFVVVEVFVHRLSPEDKRLVARAPAAATAAGCTRVMTIP